MVTATYCAQTIISLSRTAHRHGHTEPPLFNRLSFESSVPHPTQSSAIAHQTVVITNDHHMSNITLILYVIIIFNRSHCSFILFWTPLPLSASFLKKKTWETRSQNHCYKDRLQTHCHVG